MILCVYIYVLGFSIGSKSVRAIVSNVHEKSFRETGSGAARNRDIQGSASHVIERDYLSGYEAGYDHGSLGLSAHTSGSYNHDEFDGHHHEEPHLHHHHLHHVHKYHDDSAYQKALAIKGLLAPLAGVALLGAAAAFVSNPILLQLGVISGAPIGRRKRDVKRIPTDGFNRQDEIRLNEIKLLERFMAQMPKTVLEQHEKKMVANLVSCSELFSGSLCLHRLACELHSIEGLSMPTETNVFSIILNDIFNNEFVDSALKSQLSKAIHRGRQNLGCELYTCPALKKSNRRKREAKISKINNF